MHSTPPPPLLTELGIESLFKVIIGKVCTAHHTLIARACPVPPSELDFGSPDFPKIGISGEEMETNPIF